MTPAAIQAPVRSPLKRCSSAARTSSLLMAKAGVAHNMTAEKKRSEAYEKSREFKDGQRFRAGIEGRISVLFRGRGMKRCLAEGRERFELWVAAAVLANNLMKIAALLADRSSRRRKAA